MSSYHRGESSLIQRGQFILYQQYDYYLVIYASARYLNRKLYQRYCLNAKFFRSLASPARSRRQAFRKIPQAVSTRQPHKPSTIDVLLAPNHQQAESSDGQTNYADRFSTRYFRQTPTPSNKCQFGCIFGNTDTWLRDYSPTKQMYAYADGTSADAAVVCTST